MKLISNHVSKILIQWRAPVWTTLRFSMERQTPSSDYLSCRQEFQRNQFINLIARICTSVVAVGMMGVFAGLLLSDRRTSTKERDSQWTVARQSSQDYNCKIL